MRRSTDQHKVPESQPRPTLNAPGDLRSLPMPESRAKLGSSPDGLTQAEAEKRLTQSGGQSPELASARLNAMNVRFKASLPSALAFSCGRAIQQPALEIWHGEEVHVSAAQQALAHRARCSRAARRGEYRDAMEADDRERAPRRRSSVQRSRST